MVALAHGGDSVRRECEGRAEGGVHLVHIRFASPAGAEIAEIPVQHLRVDLPDIFKAHVAVCVQVDGFCAGKRRFKVEWNRFGRVRHFGRRRAARRALRIRCLRAD